MEVIHRRIHTLWISALGGGWLGTIAGWTAVTPFLRGGVPVLGSATPPRLPAVPPVPAPQPSGLPQIVRGPTLPRRLRVAVAAAAGCGMAMGVAVVVASFVPAWGGPWMWEVVGMLFAGAFPSGIVTVIDANDRNVATVARGGPRRRSARGVPVVLTGWRSMIVLLPMGLILLGIGGCVVDEAVRSGAIEAPADPTGGTTQPRSPTVDVADEWARAEAADERQAAAAARVIAGLLMLFPTLAFASALEGDDESRTVRTSVW